ncbi:MAG: hypothetical protein GY925_29060, partial [Actinomycetia bacterium]|nr:hypothetical protein [Actinomycetes bacterium]
PDPTPDRTPTPDNDHECRITETASGVELIWDAVQGESMYHLRRDDQWVESISATRFADDAGSIDRDYIVRYWQSGPHDISCEIADPEPEPQPEPTSCIATVSHDGVSVQWRAVTEVGEYNLRKNDSWLATVHGFVMTDPTGTSLDRYVVRYDEGGLKEMTCTTVVAGSGG